MPVTSVKAAFGTLLKRGGVTVAELTSIEGPAIKMDVIDATNMGSPDGYEEAIGGLLHGGEISFEGNFIPSDAAQIGLKTDFDAKTVQSWTIVGPASAAFVWTFTGLVTAFKTSFKLKDKLSFSATIHVSGKPVLSVTASTGLTLLSGIEENTGAALTFVPAFDNAKYVYNVNINTASTWVKVTPTAAAHTITIWIGSTSYPQVTGVQSGALPVVDGAVTTMIIRTQETGKEPTDYTLHIGTPL